jgi:hypothetical protein
MSHDIIAHPNDQADGFYGSGYTSCPYCIHLSECCCTLGPNDKTAKGRIGTYSEPDVVSLTTRRIPFRLAKGFAILQAAERGRSE